MNARISKDLKPLSVTLPPIAPPAREAFIATAPDYTPGFDDELAEGLCVAPFSTDVIDASIALAPRLKAARTRRDLLAQARRDLREPLTALMRLNSDWDFRQTTAVTQSMIAQQRRVLEVTTDLVDGFLTITESDVAGPAADFALRSAGEQPREVITTVAPPPETWSAAWSMKFPLARPESRLAFRPYRALLIDEDQAALGALRLYLLCAGYRVFAAGCTDEALELALMAGMRPSLIDIVIADADLIRDGNGSAAIDKTRRFAGYDVPAVLLMDQASIEIVKPGLGADVFPLRKPVNVEELNGLIGEVLKRPKARSLSSIENRWAATGIA